MKVDHDRNMVSAAFKPLWPRFRNSPTVITFVLSTTMKSIPLTLIGACAAWGVTGDLMAQVSLDDTEIGVIGGRPPVPDTALPVVERKHIRVNGVFCE